ncbi:SWIM zinc finger family protein [Halovenus salina]|uniref:SWIM zinc finger family protein n=1 Tax=Halovenus salina TaxID=1510225 RepID=A0ABD5W2T2_9EURY
MSTNETHGNESIEPRTERALTECMTVLPDGGDIYTVVGENGGTYQVDARAERCTCPDHEHRESYCKHLRRVAFATGEEPVPNGVGGVDEKLGEQLDSAPQVVATDGGVVENRAGERTRVPVAGGVLVYEERALGRELVGFEDVEEWDSLRSALAARGHSVGAVHHLPVLDE